MIAPGATQLINIQLEADQIAAGAAKEAGSIGVEWANAPEGAKAFREGLILAGAVVKKKQLALELNH